MSDEKKMLDALYEAVLSLDEESSVQAAHDVIKAGIEPEKIIEIGIKAINKIGDDYGKGLLFIPELMLGGLTMSAVMEVAQEAITSAGRQVKSEGVLMIGTVAGDTHNIGKDLVVTMWRSKGYKVHDLGIDVPRDRFISAAQELKPDVIGMSALMTTTLGEVSEVLELFKAKGLRDKYKFIVGGGVVNEEFRKQVGADAYAPDAAASLKVVEGLIKK